MDCVTNLINIKHHKYVLYVSRFFGVYQKKGKKITEPRVAVRKRAKHMCLRKLGSGEGTQRATPPGVSNHSLQSSPLFSDGTKTMKHQD